jgi:multiple sugar transport system substrate-binding protein
MAESSNMNVIIAALLILSILISAGSLYYTSSVTSQLTTAIGDLETALEDGLSNLGEDLEALPATITVIGPWAGKELDAFEPVIDRFERLTGINVVIKVLRAEDLAPVLPAQFAAGTAPGDVIFMWASFIRNQTSHMMNLTDVIDADELLAGALDEVSVGDTVYGGVYTGKVKPGFWYRKSFFAANNLTVPTTWQEFLDLLADIDGISGIVNPIVSGDGVGWPLSDVTEHFLITFGGPDLQRDLIAGTVNFTSTEVRTIFEDRIVPLLEAGYFSEPTEWTTAVDLWWDGDYALYFMGSWITGMVKNATDLGVFSLPTNEGMVFAADYYFIPAYTEYPDEAKELAAFLSSAVAQRLQVQQGGHIATALGVSLTEYPALDAQIASLTVGVDIVRDLDDSYGGVFQTTFWDQLKLLWVSPAELDDVLLAIQNAVP